VPTNIEIARAYIEGIHGNGSDTHVLRHDDASKASVSLIDEDMELVNPILDPLRGVIGLADGPVGGVLRGVTALADDLALVTKLWDIKMHEAAFYDADEFVALRGTLTTTGVRGGHPVKSDFAELFFIRDGKIYRVEIYSDTLAWKQSLEPLPGDEPSPLAGATA
jgi:ketosteroid isomerase-like protein